MSGIERTKQIKRMDVDIHCLEADPLNPNQMTDAQFNMLYDNIESVGMTDPILVVNHPEAKGKYKIIGGEHRWEVAKLIGFEEVPITLIDDADFDTDKQKFQNVRHNIIHGQMSPKKFVKLYESLSEEYTEQVAAELFGFTDEEDFRKLIEATRASLPDELKKEFDKAKKDLKTIDDLTKVLNHLFNTYGDTLPFGYMIFDFGGQESIWVRLDKSDKANFRVVADLCWEHNKTLDGVVSALLKALANDEAAGLLKLTLDTAPDVEMPAPSNEMPTLDFLDGLQETQKI